MQLNNIFINNYSGSSIYCIRNIINGKIYIGSAKRFKKRRNAHLSELRNNIHNNKRLQNAWNKYGENNFIFEIIEFIIDEKLLIQREQNWINFFNPEYNICKVAGSKLGCKCSEETKDKIRNKKLGKKASAETRKIMSEQRMGRVMSANFCKKLAIRMTGNKYTEGRKQTQEAKDKISKKHKGKILSKEQVEKSSVKVLQYDLIGNFIKEWESISSINRELGFNRSNIRKNCNGKLKKSYGSVWKYKDEKKEPVKIIQYDLKGNFIKEWNGINFASRQLFGTASRASSIVNCCNGNLKTAFGFIWKYKSELLKVA